MWKFWVKFNYIQYGFIYIYLFIYKGNYDFKKGYVEDIVKIRFAVSVNNIKHLCNLGKHIFKDLAYAC